jgi:hypothetical protein
MERAVARSLFTIIATSCSKLVVDLGGAHEAFAGAITMKAIWQRHHPIVQRCCRSLSLRGALNQVPLATPVSVINTCFS